MDKDAWLARSQRLNSRIATVLTKRSRLAMDAFHQRVDEAGEGGEGPDPAALLDPMAWQAYALDAAQRSVLFWETLWQRGSRFVDQSSEGLKPVLHFDSETVLDGRTFEQPVNYALLRILPPEGVEVDSKRRPYLIIDPRAGHGPGIGGFKDDSQVGVALRAGHPVYFVVFFQEPEPGQTLLDVCAAERRFVAEVRALHPDSKKPAIVGNCQGGWAAMMLAASDPGDTGPIVINGAPMSYWGGAWTDGESDNPMRYAGGLLGGSWTASLAADLGAGKFDGAHLVQNFENLNPANSLWAKYYHLYAHADTEPPRFLDFERWWGGFYLMNREEIEWITRNLFIGNKLWKAGDAGQAGNGAGPAFDLRGIRSPIVLFASLGDNITPPQQAFNWVADVYGSTEEIKARGQVIVGLMHQSIGHLGIFVSGQVARKEHAQIVSVLESIERLPPGLYGMVITERKGRGGEAAYEVEFREHSLEDIAARLNRFQRVDEKPFEAVAAVSEMNQRAYELFAQPVVQALSNEYSARLLREMHPLRVQNWAVSKMNPWLSWLAPAAGAVREQRQALPADHPLRRQEQRASDLLVAALDCWRDLRDAGSEAAFFSIYANIFSLYMDDGRIGEGAAPGNGNGAGHAAPVTAPVRPDVPDALDTPERGGYVEALARVAVLLTRRGEPLPLSRLELRQDLAEAYADYLPDIEPHEWRAVRGRQEIVVSHEPEQAVDSLPALVPAAADRRRLRGLVDALATDRRVLGSRPTAAQTAMLARLQRVLRRRMPARSKAA
jgi:hypothetical protein